MGYFKPVAFMFIMLLVQILFCVPSYTASKGSTWKIGKPIVWYFAGPGYFYYVNDLTVSQLKAGGWNLGWAYNRDELDVYYRHGIRALAAIENMDMSNPEQVKLLDEKLKWSDHPATYGYWICDEPHADKFENIGKVVDYLRKHDPSKPAVVNLLPVMGVADGDVVTSYRADLKKFVETVRPDVLCFDFYPFMAAGDGIYYFLNLMLINEAAQKAKIPFINITQAIAHENLGYRWPTQHEMRWLSFTTLAYGGQGLSWYIYNDMLDKPEISGFFEDTPDCQKPNRNFWAVSRINRDFEAIAEQLQKLKWIGTYHSGPHAKFGGPDDARWKFLKNDINDPANPYWARLVEPHLPYGGMSVPSDLPIKLDKSKDILLGCFGRNKKQITHILVVNLNYKSGIVTKIQYPGISDLFHASTQKWVPNTGPSEAVITLPAGGGVLVRLKQNKP